MHHLCEVRFIMNSAASGWIWRGFRVQDFAADCKSVTGYKKVRVKTLIRHPHSLAVSQPFACTWQTVSDSFSLLSFNKISQISCSFSASVVCRCPHMKVRVSSWIRLPGRPGGACCPPTPGLGDSVTALMRSGPDILSNHCSSLRPVSTHLFLFLLPGNDGREVMALGKL